MSNEITVIPKFLPPLCLNEKTNEEIIVLEKTLSPLGPQKKLKILYLGMKNDYGDESRGNSFEHDNFFPSLIQIYI